MEACHSLNVPAHWLEQTTLRLEPASPFGGESAALPEYAAHHRWDNLPSDDHFMRSSDSARPRRTASRLISAKLGECEPVRHFHGVLIWAAMATTTRTERNHSTMNTINPECFCVSFLISFFVKLTDLPVYCRPLRPARSANMYSAYESAQFRCSP